MCQPLAGPTSLMRLGGDLSSTDHTVRSSVVRASLWNGMMTLVSGSAAVSYVRSLHFSCRVSLMGRCCARAE